MRITIAIPSLTDFYFTPHRFANHGANILKEKLAARGHEVQWLNFPLEGKKRKASLPDTLHYLKPYLLSAETGRLSYFTRYWRFGPSVEECAARITDFGPEVIFLACFAFCYSGEVLELAKHLKSSMPAVPVVVGGAGATVFPEYFFVHAPVDVVLTRELETSLTRLMDVLESRAAPYSFTGIPNLYWRENGCLHVPECNCYTESGEIHFTLSKAFETTGTLYLTTSLTRGCPRRCLFCINAVCHGKVFRKVPPGKIAAGLDGLVENLRLTLPPGKKLYINFEDDNILLDPAYFFSVLNMFRRYFPEAGFLAENGIDYTLLTPPVIAQLKSLGLSHFNLSLASADVTILQNEQRFFKPERFRAVLNEIQRQGGTAISYFICGFKEDTRETLLKTLLFLVALPTYVGISPYYALPGLPGFEKELFANLDPLLCAGSSVYPWHKSLTTETMITAFRLSRFINLVKSPAKTREEMELVQNCLFKKSLFTIIKAKSRRELAPVFPVDQELVTLFFESFHSNQGIGF